jgi:putative redox protein
MKASVLWMKDGQFIAKSDSGHTLIIDGPPDHGGKNLGARPMEMVLMGLGGCTSIDVVDILKKSRQDITDCVTQLTAERASSIPAVFTKIHIHFVVTGRNLKPRQVERAVELSATKYCSATLMLQRGGVEITHDFELVDAEQ